MNPTPITKEMVQQRAAALGVNNMVAAAQLRRERALTEFLTAVKRTDPNTQAALYALHTLLCEVV